MNTSSNDGNSGDSRRQRIRELHSQREAKEDYFARVQEQGYRGLPPAPVSRPADIPITIAPRQEETVRPREGGRAGWWLVLFFSIGAMAMAGGAGYFAGQWRGRVVADREIVSRRLVALQKLTPEVAATLQGAMADMRAGKSEKAFATLQALREKNPKIASVTYLTALAALQGGHDRMAENFVKQSLQAGERMSDSFALLAVLERKRTSGREDKEADKKVEAWLRAAIAADAANPNPHVELANLLRNAGRLEEATAELQTAKTLLNPVDSQLAVDITLALMNVEKAPLETLNVTAAVPDDAGKLFAAAYAALQKNDPDRAVTLLRRCQDLLPPDIFAYVIDDPALRKFAGRSELRNFYQP